MKSLFSLTLFLKIFEFSKILCVNFWIKKDVSWPAPIVRDCHGKTIHANSLACRAAMMRPPFLGLASCSDTISKALLLSGEPLECHRGGLWPAFCSVEGDPWARSRMKTVQCCPEDCSLCIVKPVFLTFSSDSLNFIQANIFAWIKSSSLWQKKLSRKLSLL